jgi:YebC/PmpR family DNA-binding regulatory protein
MSGHSHWSSIKHKKGAADAKRSKLFSKLAREITVAAREGGGDVAFNSKLRMVVDKAKSLNMPADNVDRAIKKGTGEIEGDALEPIIIEAYGPGGVSLIIEGITDNKNRTLGEIKKILNEYGGKMVAEGAIRWMFDRKGVIEVDASKIEGKTKEDMEMLAIESGAVDTDWREELLEIYTNPEDLEKVRKGLETAGVPSESASPGWIAKDSTNLGEKEKGSCQKLFEALDENDAIQEIYSNIGN